MRKSPKKAPTPVVEEEVKEIEPNHDEEMEAIEVVEPVEVEDESDNDVQMVDHISDDHKNSESEEPKQSLVKKYTFDEPKISRSG